MDLSLTNTVLIKEFNAGSISLNKEEEDVEGLFKPLDRNSEETEGHLSQFYINGLPRIKASINQISFEDDSQYLCLDRNYAGPEWLWDQFNKRLKLGIYKSKNLFFAFQILVRFQFYHCR